MAEDQDQEQGTPISPFEGLISRRDILKAAGVGVGLASAGMVATSPLGQVASAAHTRDFHIAWPYEAPPTGHFNTFGSNSLAIIAIYGNIYQDLVEMPLAKYLWASGTYEPWMATSWKLTSTTFTVKLRQGTAWSDGSMFTAQDVLTTFSILRLISNQVWQYLDKVTAPDKYTVVFHMSTPASVVPNFVLETWIRADSVYSKFGREVEALVAAGKTMDSPEAKNLRLQLDQYRPQAQVSSGPFMFDPNSTITSGQYILVKNHKSWAAAKVRFDRLVNYNGETPALIPLVLAKQIDYATEGFPPASIKAFQAHGIHIVKPPLGSGASLYINFKAAKPLADKRVRQALAYAIDRHQNAIVSLGESAKPPVYMAGMSDSVARKWVASSALAKLNGYAYNPAKAASILAGLGFKKGSNGIYVAPDGNKMDYTLEVPADYSDWSAAAQNLAEQMTAFGVKMTVKPVTSSQSSPDIDRGKIQLAINNWGAGSPFPQFSYFSDMNLHNPPVAEGPGTGLYNLNMGVDFKKLIKASGAGLDAGKQRLAVAQIAAAFNDLLPIIPLWERLGNNVALSGVRVAGWPADSDPIYQNSPYSDSFVTILIVRGTLYGI